MKEDDQYRIVPSGNTREEILKVGLRLLRKYSYHSISFGDIANEIGIKKSSIHYYFSNKDVLGVALIQYYADLIKSYIAEIDTNKVSPTQQIEAYVEFFRIGLEKKYLCPLGVLSVEIFTLPPEMQDELQLLVRDLLEWLTRVCQRGLDEKEFQFEVEPGDMAYYISTAVEGAAAMARAYDTPQQYQVAMKILLRNLLVKNH